MPKIEDVLLFQIDQTSKVAKQYSNREFEKMQLDITVEQWVVLKIISESDDLSQRELAKRTFRDPASITRTIDLLQKKNYVRRKTIPDNRRRYNVILTPIGRKIINTHFNTIRKQRIKSTDGFTEQELYLLSAMLRRIRENMA